MSVYLRGPKPFAVVLLNFNDLLLFPAGRQELTPFFTSEGKGGIFDYYRDISYANIDFSGSEVFGWFTMQYSFANDSNDPLHNGSDPRNVWISKAQRLCKANGVDLARFYGVVAVVNASVADTSNRTHNTALGIGQWHGQGKWQYCKKCYELSTLDSVPVHVLLVVPTIQRTLGITTSI
jgi:hypothetical protein